MSSCVCVLMTCAVYFNLDGTLVSHDLDYDAIYRGSVDAAGLDALMDDYEEYTDRFFKYFQDGWAFPRRQAIRDRMAEHGIEDQGQSDAFAVAWEDAEADAVTLMPGAEAALDELDDRPLGVVTNGTGRLQRAKLERLGIADRFDIVLVSSEIGVVKPNSEFFGIAREALDADRYVMVSQELRRDVLPAKRAEFATIWLSTQEGSAQVERLIDRRVQGLADVPAAVADLCE